MKPDYPGRKPEGKYTDPNKIHKKLKPAIDYSSLEYKHYDNTIKIGVKLGGNPFPENSRAPNAKKYDAKGNYIKDKYIAAKHRPNPKKEPLYSIGKIVRESSMSNTKKRHGK